MSFLPLHSRSVSSVAGKSLVICLALAFAFGFVPLTSPEENSSKILDQPAILTFLNQSVTWYQRMAAEREVANTPSDIFFATDNRPLADQIVRLSFEFAKAGSQMLEKDAGAASPVAQNSRYQALSQTVAKLDNQANQTRQEVDTLQEKLAKATPAQRKKLEPAIAETKSELALLQARSEVLHSMLQFIGGASEPGGLTTQIDALERSVPRATNGEGQGSSSSSGNAASAAIAVASPAATEFAGIWGNLRDLFALNRKLSVVRANARETEDLTQAVKQMQGPLTNRLREMVRQSDSIVNQPDSQDPGVLAQQKATLDGLTAQFKSFSTALLPLSKESVLLDVYARNLATWQAAIKGQYSTSIKSLLVRLLGLGLFLAIVLGAFELWRRAIYRYIPDMRRRYQFLLLRRIALWLTIAMIITFGLVSELGSLATFAGLLTAGVAVALQNVILAVVGYFLLIGKYGVRVGDRVTVSGVTGEVMEIGLIRLHVMEMVGFGVEAQPTGRVVAFSNSVVFQPTASLFKQAPGTSFMWHEISLTLAADSNYRLVEQRMLTAVDAAFKDYQKDFEALRRQIEHNLTSISVGSLEPKVRFHLTATGLEVNVRFPVEPQKAAEIDDRVTRELLHAIELDPPLKIVGAEVPTVRLKTEAPAPGTSPA